MIELLRECREWIQHSEECKYYVMSMLIPEEKCDCGTFSLRLRLDAEIAALAGKEQNAAPQPSTATFKAAPSAAIDAAAASSQEGVGRGEVAGAAPGLPEQRLIAGGTTEEWRSQYTELLTFALQAVAERDEAWAALRDAYYGVGSHDSAAWQKKHAATIAAAQGAK